ncbi:MAG: hypothetical protein U9Q74_14990, partial [Gemmatimonadota bacterium]|nr:hypothetical protein [Gemmatimonadota bacterium]
VPAGNPGGMRRAWAMPGRAAAVTAAGGANFAAAGTVHDGRPALEPARVVGELFAGAYAGIAGYFVGTWAGTVVADALPTESQDTKDKLGFAFGATGAALATAASVAAVGNIGDQTGSYPTALAGTAGGIAAGVLLNQLIYGHARLPTETSSSRMRWVSASIEALLPSLGATIAFNSTRRFK